MPPRKLLHVFPSFDVGGVENRFVQLANYFGDRYQHFIVAMDGRTDAAKRLDAGLDVTMVPIVNRKGQLLHNVWAFRRVLKELRPDLLVTSNWGSIEWGMANLDHFVPHVHLEDGFGSEEAKGQLFRRIWMRRLVLSRSLVVLPALTLLRVAREEWKLPSRRCLHLPNGVDVEKFNMTAQEGVAQKYGIARDRSVIGTVAGLRPEKNLSRLFDAFALILKSRPAQLVIVGDGPLMGQLKQEASAKGVSAHVLFTGASTVPEQFLPLFSVFALTSDTEQMPLSILEAMAAARPIVSTDVGDVREMVAPENAPFVVPRNADSIGEAMLALISDSNMAKRIGQANRERAISVYDQRKMFASYERLFDGNFTNPGARA